MKKFLLLSALVFIPCQAMAIDFSTVLFDFRGNPITDETNFGPRDPQTGKLTQARFCFKDEFLKDKTQCDYATLGIVSAYALTRGADPSDKDLSPSEIIHRRELADKVGKGGNIELSPEDVVLIRRMVSKSYAVVVAGAALPLLTGNNK